MTAAAVALGAVLVFSGGSRSYPSHWDARLAPIAARVEALRGSAFKHPVPVHYLSATDFEKELTTDPAELKKERKQIEQATGLFRAGGLIGPNVDLVHAFDATQTADTIAFYDPDRKAVFVRGNGAFTVETRVTLAHELTHVIQDQYFDLNKIRKLADASKSGSADALRALIEGDAVRIQDLYLAEQSSADRSAFARLSAQDSSRAGQRTQDIPAAVDVLFGAPYIFGPQVVKVLNSIGGNSAVNSALTGPAPTTRMFLDPTDTHAPKLPARPKLTAGEKKLPSYSNGDDQFDDFTLYLILAARLDAPTALRAADAYASGSEVLFSRSGATCFRAAITGVNPGSEAFLAKVVRQWTNLMPDAGIDATSPTLVFHSCDPGARAGKPHDAGIKQATSLAAGRDAVIATLIGENVPSRLATCVARLLVDRPNIRNAILRDQISDAVRTEIRSVAASAGFSCRTNPQTGLP